LSRFFIENSTPSAVFFRLPFVCNCFKIMLGMGIAMVDLPPERNYELRITVKVAYFKQLQFLQLQLFRLK